MADPDTYFEQIPVAVVKKIAEVIPAQEGDEIPAAEEAPAIPRDTSAPESWRELAQQAQQETDSKKMIDLVQQLIVKYDEEKMHAGKREVSDPL